MTRPPHQRYHPNNPWTLERLGRLKAMLPGRRKADDMAQELGVTKNAVIGAIHRHGWVDLWVKASRPPPPNTKLREVEPPAPPAAPRAPRVRAGPQRFLDRRPYECSSILNFGASVEELMVCGGRIPPDSHYAFCEEHRRQYLVQPTPAAARRSTFRLQRLVI